MIDIFNALAGAGKTYAYAKYAETLAARGQKVLIVQPTKALIDKTFENELRPKKSNTRIFRFHGDAIDSVVRSLVDHFRNNTKPGDIVFTTHAAFMMAGYFHRAKDWIVLFDEVPRVDQYFERNVPDNHHLLTQHIEAVPDGASFVKLQEKPGSSLRKIARNNNNDEAYKLFGDLAGWIASPHWDVLANASGYNELISRRSPKLIAHGCLKPSIFTQFKEVIVAAACIEDTMLHQLWSASGVKFRQVGTRLTKHLRYQTHANGPLLTIHYAFDSHWSKNLRDKIVDGAPLLTHVTTAITTLFGQSPFLWMANVDVADTHFATTPSATRLPNSPHGLNQ